MSWNTSVQKGQNIPNDLERKQILYRDPAFIPNVTLVLDSSERNSGSINHPTWYLATAIQSAYAVSLKSMNMPVSWPNVAAAQTIAVTYGGGSFPTSVTLPIGRYSYDPEIGILTYATVNAAPATSFLDDIMYALMRAFQGAITSIAINPCTGVWTWTWNTSCVSVTSTSPSVQTFFKITGITSNPPIWTSSGMVDLTGTKCLTINCNDLVTGGYLTPATQTQSYLCSCPVGNVQYGDLFAHSPPIEKITWFGSAGKYISSITLSVTDPATDLLLPLTSDWCVELKFYLDVPQ